MKKNKKIIGYMFFFFLLSVFFTQRDVYALTSGNWEYIVENNSAIIIGYSGEESYVNIPSTLDGYSVVQIGYDDKENEVIYAPFIRNANVVNVTIPNTVRKVMKYALYNCSNLTTVNIPDSVKMLDSEFIYGNNNVDYTIPSNLTLLSNGEYRELTEVTTLGGTSMYNMEYEILELVNQERQKAGVNPLELDAQLTEDANLRAAEVAVYYSHNRPSGDTFYSAITNPCYYAGENIAAGYRSSQEVMNAWMQSEGHKENILDENYKSIGIGVYLINGTYYYSQDFTTSEKISDFNKTGQEVVNYTFPVCTYDGRFSNVQINELPSTLSLQKSGEYTVSNVYLSNTEFYNLKIPVTLNSINWNTSNESIASVDENGKITALKGGAANITATIGEFSKLCTVMVEVPLDRIEIEGKSELDISNSEDNSATYVVKYYPEDTTSPRRVTWLVDNPDILTIDNDGKVTLLKTGNATITATTLNGKDARFNVKVVKHITGISLEQSEINMFVDEEKLLNAYALPEDTTDDKTLSFVSSNPTVATVDTSGKIIPLKVGLTYIDVTSSNGKFKRCKVNVIKRNIEDVNMASIYPRVYTGDEIKPKLYLTINGKKLVEDEDYTLTYDKNIDIGIADIIIEGKGNYEGVRTEHFEIINYLKGDVNEDTFINSTDAALILDIYKNGNATSRQYETGDMNEDTILNSIDAAMILDVFKNGLN